jgi:hypothetical protein
VTEALAWAWLPVVLFVLPAGAALLAERAAGHQLPDALLAPVGFAGLVVVVTGAYRLGLTRMPVLLLVVALAAAGYVLAWRQKRARPRPGPALLAALAAFVLYLAPVALSGHWSWAGYNFTNDPSLNLVTATWVLDHGFAPPARADDTDELVVAGQLAVKYPLGAFLLLGTLTPLAGIDLAAAMQPFIAMLAAFGAAALVHLLRRSGMPAPVAVPAAVLAVGAHLLYVYGQIGGVKEVATVAVLATAAALGHEAIRERLSVGLVALCALVLGSLAPIFSLGGIGYAGLFAAGLLLAALVLRPWRTGRELALALVVGAVTFGVAVAPSLADTLKFGAVAQDAFSGAQSTGVFGQLLRPLPLEQAFGVWLADDWRAPVVGALRAPATHLLNALMLAAALLGVVWAMLRRASFLPVLAAVIAFALIAAPRVTPYGDSKLLVVLTPFVVIAAAAGLWFLSRLRRRVTGPLALALAIPLALGVLASDAITYRETRLAPPDRVEAIRDVGEAARGHGLVLFNEWEEYAKYFARAADLNVPGETSGPRPFVLREDAPTFGQHFDLDEQALAYVLTHDGIVVRRAPDASRPPASFRRVYANDWYELWLRRPGVEVREHLPLQSIFSRQLPVSCLQLQRLARRARPGERLVAARWAPNVVMNTQAAPHSPGWVPTPGRAGTLTPLTPGDAGGPVPVPGGQYRVWVNGSSGRAVHARIDGRTVGSLKHVNTPEQWVEVATVELTRGTHRLELVRPGGSLGPGNAYQGELGPMFLEPTRGPELVSRSPRDYRDLCGQDLDWVELVRGRV